MSWYDEWGRRISVISLDYFDGSYYQLSVVRQAAEKIQIPYSYIEVIQNKVAVIFACDVLRSDFLK